MPDSLLSSYLPTSESPIYAYLNSRFYARAVFDGFLTRRGWILQERILSPRTVYFGQEEVFWECSSVTASETIPWGWKDKSPLVKFNSYDLALPTGTLLTSEPPHLEYQQSPKKIRRSFGDIHESDTLGPLYNYWYRLVEAYTGKDLTKSEDRLPAIFGLAQAIHKSGMPYKIFSECYLDGIWLLEPSSLLWYLKDSPDVGDVKIHGNPSYTWGSWGNSAAFLTNNIVFCDQSQLVEFPIIESLGGHPSTQTAIIRLPDESTKGIRSRQTSESNIIQVQGQLDIGIMTLNTVKYVINPTLSGPGPTVEPSPLTCELSYQSESGRHATVIIDGFPDESLSTWLKKAQGTVWLLKLAIGKGDGNTRIPWISSGDFYTGGAPTGYYDFGLILIPTKDDLEALRELQDTLDIWNTPALKPNPTSYGWRDLLDRPSTPPDAALDVRKWMRGNERMEAYKLVGPHNTTFRRVGIYRSRASTYTSYREHHTTVLLA
jgi:hypothetical protein